MTNNIRYEIYDAFDEELPFYLQSNIERTQLMCSHEPNWHENLEIELCTYGSGYILCDGEQHRFAEGDIAIISSGLIHYTGTSERIKYTCLIIDNDFCNKVGVDYKQVRFELIVRDEHLKALILELCNIIHINTDVCRRAKLYDIILRILIHIREQYSVDQLPDFYHIVRTEPLKSAILFIHENYCRHFNLDELARTVYKDKYALCREFKRYTGRTIVEYTNDLRCHRAVALLKSGKSVSEAARLCGFENMSFFAKIFRRHIGRLPSDFISR